MHSYHGIYSSSAVRSSCDCNYCTSVVHRQQSQISAYSPAEYAGEQQHPIPPIHYTPNFSNYYPSPPSSFPQPTPQQQATNDAQLRSCPTCDAEQRFQLVLIPCSSSAICSATGYQYTHDPHGQQHPPHHPITSHYHSSSGAGLFTVHSASYPSAPYHFLPHSPLPPPPPTPPASKPTPKCPHGKRRTQCLSCFDLGQGGGSICAHRRRKDLCSWCKEYVRRGLERPRVPGMRDTRRRAHADSLASSGTV
ncbi:hypothetical protein DFJ73DRAFT_839029 [Zopfochytrium polystomum]|nr:hypothetical protein DFJ73DRAFT_839029 [Zopfochytrium polystomum]